ncbi:hypothetical protein Mapa_006249 [Marchantia paleacea]|nr:hypothetical protein Mapa_006249 [Marchantia paleacea]
MATLAGAASATWGSVARHSLPAASFKSAYSFSSSFWTQPSLLRLAFVAEEKKFQREGGFVIFARKKSGFAELLFNRKNEQQGEGSQRPRLQRGRVSPRLDVPANIPRPPYVNSLQAPDFVEDYQIQDAEGIVGMKAAGKLAAAVLSHAGTLVKSGVTTDEIDKAVHQMIIEAGAYPSPLGYGAFPKSVCTSVNECICHGIPDSRALLDGDIINIDVTVYLNGYHGDTSKTFLCGNVSEEGRQLVEVTREALDKAISICGPGVEFKKIGKVIHDIADKYKYGVVRHFVGHGVGKIFHSGPSILHFRNSEPGRMAVNQTFTIEPMLTIGTIKGRMWDDRWTVVTEDGSLSAQFEHTLLITETGVEILTA